MPGRAALTHDHLNVPLVILTIQFFDRTKAVLSAPEMRIRSPVMLQKADTPKITALKAGLQLE